MLMVDREWAGHDFGERAPTWAEERLNGYGKDRAHLDVTASNDTLRDWYVDRGYEVVGTREFDHPDWNDVILLEKNV